MTKLSELQKAVANRNFEHDAIDEDLEFVEYLYAGKYWVDISSAYGCITTGFICTGTGPTADIYQGEIFIEPDDFSKKIKAEKLDEYVENSYILKELAEYVKDNTENLLEVKLNNDKKASE